MAVGIPDDARTGETAPVARTSRHFRRTKLVAAFAVTALVGVGSYAATYRALVVVSTPPGAVTVAPAGGTVTVPAPATPAQRFP
jgi:hypothetical protein